jgi:hypothetical protein
MVTRREAAENNLDPNIWFNNVERIAARASAAKQ